MPSKKTTGDPMPLYDDPSLSFNLSASEAAKLLGISERMLWTLTNSGEVPHIRLGRRTLYPKPLLEKWILERARAKKD